MCGIAGAVFWEPDEAGCDPVSIVRRMTDALAHRGPDGQGVMLCPTAAAETDRGPIAVLGHRRLAIIDLSDRAAQPMAASPAPVRLTCNGEVYNFQDLRRELAGMGHAFRSNSDTEVVLQGYERWGAGVLERMRGMFALAIWDGRTNRLLLARDRLGIKPLYVHHTPRCLLFASEVRALLASGLVAKTLDRTALDQYLASQTVSPPRTLVSEVWMIPPGCCVTSGPGGRVTERRYWDLLDSASPDAAGATEEGGRRRTRELLEESTRLHLVADVPVGVFLSGGIDSSAVAALVRQAGATPRTFCISFPGTAHDEGPFARATATALGAEHTEIQLTEDDFCRQLPEALGSVDHPSGDALNTFVVARAVRAAGVKVALSGLGGDELFGGYPSFSRLRRIAGYVRAWQWSPPPVRRLTAAAVRAIAGPGVGTDKAAALLETAGGVPRAYRSMRQLFTPGQRARLVGEALVDAARIEGDPGVNLLEQAMVRHPHAGLAALVSYAEARLYMHDVLLRDTDQMSMAHALEVRVPLLDHRLAEWVMGLPDAIARPRHGGKRLLCDALDGLLPADIASRPKQGFVLPMDAWMRGGLKTLCERHLGPRGLGGRDIFRPDAISSVWQAFLEGERSTTWSRSWALVALDAWMERTGVQ